MNGNSNRMKSTNDREIHKKLRSMSFLIRSEKIETLFASTETNVVADLLKTKLRHLNEVPTTCYSLASRYWHLLSVKNALPLE